MACKRTCGSSAARYNARMEVNDKTLTELVRLTEENNRMLHKMRRSAFLWGFFKFVFYVLVLVVAPLWVYSVYLAPLVAQMGATMDRMQRTGTSVQAQIDGWQQAWEDLQSKIPFAQQKQ